MSGLKENFSFALVGNLFYAFCQYLVLLIYIKLFSTDDVGAFIYAGAFTTPLLMALDMQMRNFYITDTGEISFRQYHSFRALTNLIGVIVMLISALLFKPVFFLIITTVVATKVLESQIDILYGAYQKKNILKYVALSRILRGSIMVIVVFTISLLFHNLVLSIVSYFIAWLLFFFLYEKPYVVKRGVLNKRDFKLMKIKRPTLKQLLILGIPMAVYIFIDKAYVNYPRIKTEAILGTSMLAIWGGLLYIKVIGAQVVGALSQASMPTLSKYFIDRNKKSFNKLVIILFSLGLVVGFALYIIFYMGGEKLLTLIYTEEYAKYTDVLLVVILGTSLSFCYVFITGALTCMRKQWIKLPVSCFAFALLYIYISFNGVNTLMDMALCVLYVELTVCIIYILIYLYFMFVEDKYIKKHNHTASS